MPFGSGDPIADVGTLEGQARNEIRNNAAGTKLAFRHFRKSAGRSKRRIDQETKGEWKNEIQNYRTTGTNPILADLAAQGFSGAPVEEQGLFNRQNMRSLRDNELGFAQQMFLALKKEFQDRQKYADYHTQGANRALDITAGDYRKEFGG